MRTTSGYTGGRLPDPNYHRLGDHTESVEVEFDPARVSYRELLRVFWESHDPRSVAWSRQYRNAVFWHGDDQKRLVLESRAEVEGRLGRDVKTDVEPAGRFYPAEDYHQKYALKARRDLWEDLRSRFGSASEAEASTAAARLNGYLGGYGRPAARDLDALGLSSDGRAKLKAAIGLGGE